MITQTSKPYLTFVLVLCSLGSSSNLCYLKKIKNKKRCSPHHIRACWGSGSGGALASTALSTKWFPITGLVYLQRTVFTSTCLSTEFHCWSVRPLCCPADFCNRHRSQAAEERFSQLESWLSVSVQSYDFPERWIVFFSLFLLLLYLNSTNIYAVSLLTTGWIFSRTEIKQPSWSDFRDPV